MKAILQFLERERYWPLWAVLIAAVVIFPGLGEHGFWEPDEIRVADSASERVRGDGEEPAETGAAEQPRRGRDRIKGRTSRGTPLEEWLIGQGIVHINPYADSGEFGARLPLALLGLVSVLCAFFLGRRMATPRAGLLAAMILVSFPVFIMQSRLLLSDMGTVAASGLVVLGLVGLVWPAQPRAVGWYPIDAILVALGLVLGYFSTGALLGVFVPLGAVALACVAALIGRLPEAGRESGEPRAGERRADYPVRGRVVWLGLGLLLADFGWIVIVTAIGRPEWITPYHAAAAALGVLLLIASFVPGMPPPSDAAARRRRWQLVGGLLASTAAAVLVLLYVFSQIWDLRPPVPGERALFGYSLMPSGEYVEAIGGQWKLRGDLKFTFDALFESIGYGLFPWVALAPIALPQLAMTPRRGRRTWTGYLLLAWAALAWVVAAVVARKVDVVMYPALVAVAVGLGIWLDDLLAARNEADATAHSDRDARSSFGVTLRLPLIALFVFAALVVLGKDMMAFPDNVVSLSAADGGIKYPADTSLLKIPLKYWHLTLGIGFGVSLAAGLMLWNRCKKIQETRPLPYYAGRYGIHAAVAIGLLIAMFTAHGWIPRLSQKLSSKHIFTVYRETKNSGDLLGIMGNYGSGPQYYAGGSFEKITGRPALTEFLGKPGRVFALVPETELCAVHRTFKNYYVLDDSNAKFLLLSNQLDDGEDNKNPLYRTIPEDPPEDIPTSLDVNYDDRIELIGVDMPASVGRGDSFTMKLYFKVLKSLGGNWKIFVHFDTGMRFQGDHDPVDTVRCSTSYWQPGNFIVDEFEVTAGNITYARGEYAVHVGLFRGSHGNWKNMKVVHAKGPAANRIAVGEDDRVRIGQIRVE